MGKAYEPDELATRTFVVGIAGIAAFIAVVFLFVLPSEETEVAGIHPEAIHTEAEHGVPQEQEAGEAK